MKRLIVCLLFIVASDRADACVWIEAESLKDKSFTEPALFNPAKNTKPSAHIERKPSVPRSRSNWNPM